MKQTALILLFAIVGMSFSSGPEAKSDWIYLFDGSSTKGWRAYNGDVLPMSKVRR